MYSRTANEYAAAWLIELRQTNRDLVYCRISESNDLFVWSRLVKDVSGGSYTGILENVGKEALPQGGGITY